MQVHSSLESVFDTLNLEKIVVVNKRRLMQHLNDGGYNVTGNRMNEVVRRYRAHTGDRTRNIFVHETPGEYFHLFETAATDAREWA